MVNEQDIELLETFLDGELDAPQAATLKARLQSDAPLAAELQRLQHGRELRMQAWQACESADDSSERIIAAIHAKAQRRAWYLRLVDYRQQIAAAAACIAVFLIGWQWGQHVGAVRVTPGSAPAAQPVGLITQQQIPSGQSSVFEVRVTGTDGKVVRVERFGTLQEAQQYIARVQKELLEARQQP